MSTARTGTEATGGVTPVPHNSPRPSVSPALRTWCLRAACTVCLAATVLGSYVITTFPRPL